MSKSRVYFCIDMKTFFASVECAERNLNPFETNLVVADKARGDGAICLAVSPKMKQQGVRNRCRIFEIPKNIDYIVAKPRMKKYIEYAADIYEIYLNYISKDDIHVYSIDESFIDATDYLKIYNLSPKEFAVKLINEIATIKHIPATAGIGTNMFLAKIALDITAKSAPDHIGFLTEEIFRATLWHHKPITDFWQIAQGTAKRLEKYNAFDLEGITRVPEELLYKEFGINAEILIDHAWGRESCTIKDIKEYKSQSKSVSRSQILFSDYDFNKARLVVNEMTLNISEELMRQHLITHSVSLGISYSKNVMPPTGATLRMLETTNVYSVILKYIDAIYDQTTFKDVPIRQIMISCNNVCNEGCEGYTLFTDFDSIQKEKQSEHAVIDIKSKYGKNAILRGSDLEEGATTIYRNKTIGGHNAE